jgi:hypothetical protein
VTRFSDALRAAIVTGVVEGRPLREAAAAFAVALRHGGARPEQAVIAVKSLVQETINRRTNIDRTTAGDLLRRVVLWAIEAYYRAD